MQKLDLLIWTQYNMLDYKYSINNLYSKIPFQKRNRIYSGKSGRVYNKILTMGISQW